MRRQCSLNHTSWNRRLKMASWQLPSYWLASSMQEFWWEIRRHGTLAMSLPSERKAIINLSVSCELENSLKNFYRHCKLSAQIEMRAFVQNLTVHNRKSFNIPRMASNSQSHNHSWQNKTRTTDKTDKWTKKDHSKCNTVSSTKIKRGRINKKL